MVSELSTLAQSQARTEPQRFGADLAATLQAASQYGSQDLRDVCQVLIQTIGGMNERIYALENPS